MLNEVGGASCPPFWENILITLWFLMVFQEIKLER